MPWFLSIPVCTRGQTRTSPHLPRNGCPPSLREPRRQPPAQGSFRGGGGGWGPTVRVPKMAPPDFPDCKFRFLPRWSLWSGGGGGWSRGGNPPSSCGVRPFGYFPRGTHPPPQHTHMGTGMGGTSCPRAPRQGRVRGGGFGTRPWWLALLACGGAYWPLAFEPSAMTSRHPYYCGHPHCRGHPPAWGGIQNATSAHGVLP